MMGWKDGDDPAVALIRLYGDDIKEAIDDPEKQEAIAAANKEYMERVAKEKQYEDEYSANLEQSLTLLEKAQKEKGLSDEQIDDAMAWFIGVAKDAMIGKFSPETIEMIIKAQNYDNDVAQAGEEGKNGGGRRKPPMPDMGAIDRYADGNMNIFERGGEKRTPIKR